MANSERRQLDNNGNQFIPMNVEGGTWNDHFISTPKLVLIIIMAISLILIILTLVDRSAKITAWVIYFALYIGKSSKAIFPYIYSTIYNKIFYI